jgi:hypothetical protein
LISVLLFTGLVGSISPLLSQADSSNAISASSERQAWMGPAGKPLPFKTHDEIKDFLLTAKVIRIEEIPVGVTEPRKVLLEKNGVQVHSCFKTVNIHKGETILFLPEPNRRLHWRDCCMFECAAYELSRMLGLDNVLPVVQREIEEEEGVLLIWLENALMERERAKLNVNPPDLKRHEMQMDVLRVFDALVHNDDRNPTNILYDPEWKLWMLDHTRCFPRVSDLPETNQVKRCERRLWRNLQNLNDEVVKEALTKFLKKAEIKALLKRRDKLINYIQDLIDKRGETVVLFRLEDSTGVSAGQKREELMRDDL